MEKKQLIKDLITQLIQLVIFCLLMNRFWGTEQWYIDKVKEMSFFLLVTVIFFLTSLFTRIITTPIRIEISQENKEFELPFTTFSIKGRTKTQEYQRTIKMKICVERKYSFWGIITTWLLKKSNMKLVVVPSALGINVQAKDEVVLNGVSSFQNGFKFNIGEYLENNLKFGQSGQYSKTINYIITEDRSTVVQGEKFQISPNLKVNKWYYKIIYIFIRYKIEFHTVHFNRG